VLSQVRLPPEQLAELRGLPENRLLTLRGLCIDAIAPTWRAINKAPHLASAPDSPARLREAEKTRCAAFIKHLFIELRAASSMFQSNRGCAERH
jgi:hypothetical protein